MNLVHFTLYTLLRSVSVSNIEYIPLSIDTTSIGVILLQISVKVTTSENNIETLSNICDGETKTRDSKYQKISCAREMVTKCSVG